MSGAPDPVGMTALELADAIRRGTLGSVELTSFHLERIARLEQAMPWRGRVPPLVAKVS